MSAADVAEVSSLTSMLTDLEGRILALAKRWEEAKRDDVVAALHDAERHLRSANRALTISRKALERK